MPERIPFAKALKLIKIHQEDGATFEEVAAHFNEQTYRKPNGSRFRPEDVKRIVNEGLSFHEQDYNRRRMLQVYPSK